VGTVDWGRHIIRFLGVAGVALHEREKARRWANRLEIPLLLVTLWIPLQWYLVFRGIITEDEGASLDELVWGLFLFEQVILLSLVHDRRYYLQTNWLTVGIVLLGLPLIVLGESGAVLALRFLRGLMVLIMFARLGKRYFRELGRHVAFAILLMTVFLVIVGGVLMPLLEPGYFHDFADGAWWAIVTLSTVGYGDFVPHTGSGRLLGAVFVIFGVIWMGLISASIAAFLVGLKVEAAAEDDQSVDLQMMRRLDRIEQSLNRLERHLVQKRGADEGP